MTNDLRTNYKITLGSGSVSKTGLVTGGDLGLLQIEVSFTNYARANGLSFNALLNVIGLSRIDLYVTHFPSSTDNPDDPTTLKYCMNFFVSLVTLESFFQKSKK